MSENGYTLRAPDYEEWFSSLRSDQASLQAAFAAGDAHGADSQRSMIFEILPELVGEAEEGNQRLADLLRDDLLRLQADESPTEPGGAEEARRQYSADLAAHSGPFGRLVP